MKQDPIAVALRAIVVLISAAGALTTLATWATLPAFAGVAYLLIFAFAATIGALGL